MTESAREPGDTQTLNQRDRVGLPTPDAEFVLSGRSTALIESLGRKSGDSGRASAMYSEALRAMWRNDGRESLHVAAYELREFMNALPQALALPVVPFPQLNDKVKSFVRDWKGKAAHSACRKDGQWVGEIDGPLRSVIESTETFVTWIETTVPARKSLTAVVLQKLSPTDDPLPDSLVQMATDEWSELLQYFNFYAHHNGDPDSIDFRVNVERLERFLLDLLAPRTFDDQRAIDQLIQEAET